jgi:hypothetical protein
MQYQITDVLGIVEVLAVIGLLTFSFCHVRFLNDLGTGKRGAIECWEVGDALAMDQRPVRIPVKRRFRKTTY